MGYDVITVTPVLSAVADDYQDNEVLFVSTAVKLPHRNCKVLDIFAIWDDNQLSTTNDREFLVFFFKENTTDLGSLGGSPSITGAQLKANSFLGATRLVNNSEDSLHGGRSESDSGAFPHLFVGQHMNDTGSSSTGNSSFVIEEGSTKNTCFVQGLYEVGETSSGTDTFAADSLTLTICVEY
tara:strand:- start:1359 stop:1904 length:546 start_codon:yes stop_codon:yes gene_type:complete